MRKQGSKQGSKQGLRFSQQVAAGIRPEDRERSNLGAEQLADLPRFWARLATEEQQIKKESEEEEQARLLSYTEKLGLHLLDIDEEESDIHEEESAKAPSPSNLA